MLFALLVAIVVGFSTFVQGRGGQIRAETQGTAMETHRGSGKGMPWSPDRTPRMGPRGMEPEIGGRRHYLGGEDRFNGRQGSSGGRFSRRHGFDEEDRFNGRHGFRGGRFSRRHGFEEEDRFNRGMMKRPMRG